MASSGEEGMQVFEDSSRERDRPASAGRGTRCGAHTRNDARRGRAVACGREQAWRCAGRRAAGGKAARPNTGACAQNEVSSSMTTTLNAPGSCAPAATSSADAAASIRARPASVRGACRTATAQLCPRQHKKRNAEGRCSWLNRETASALQPAACRLQLHAAVLASWQIVMRPSAAEGSCEATSACHQHHPAPAVVHGRQQPAHFRQPGAIAICATRSGGTSRQLQRCIAVSPAHKKQSSLTRAAAAHAAAAAARAAARLLARASA